MAIELVFETHSATVDNEPGRATGWLPGRLSEQGRLQARQLGRRRGGDGSTRIQLRPGPRRRDSLGCLRGHNEPGAARLAAARCDYGQRNGMPVAALNAGRREHGPAVSGRGKLAAGHSRVRPFPRRPARCAGMGGGSWSSVMSPPGCGPGSLHRRRPAGRSHRARFRLARRMGIPGQLAEARRSDYSCLSWSIWATWLIRWTGVPPIDRRTGSTTLISTANPAEGTFFRLARAHQELAAGSRLCVQPLVRSALEVMPSFAEGSAGGFPPWRVMNRCSAICRILRRCCVEPRQPPQKLRRSVRGQRVRARRVAAQHSAGAWQGAPALRDADEAALTPRPARSARNVSAPS